MSTPVRVLALLDQHLIAQTIVLTLNHGVFDTQVVETPVDALRMVLEWQPQVAVVDMDLGNAELLRQIGVGQPGRETRIPVLGLTRRGDLRTTLAAFDQGLDDILTMPFCPEELLARTVAATRRAYGENPPFSSVLRIREMEIDILNREVRAGTSVVHLTSLEQSLLYLLAANAGHVITRDEIMDAIWGTDFVAESNVVDRHIRALRVKLQNDYRRPRFIATVEGKGYRFTPTFTAMNA